MASKSNPNAKPAQQQGSEAKPRQREDETRAEDAPRPPQQGGSSSGQITDWASI